MNSPRPSISSKNNDIAGGVVDAARGRRRAISWSVSTRLPARCDWRRTGCSRWRTAAADRTQRLASIVTVAGSGLVVLLAAISIVLVRRSARARDQAEALMRDNNLDLEVTVDERTADLREANEEIQRFAYIVSHDLRSPLVNIMGFTSELEELRTDIFRRIADTSPRSLFGAAGAGGAGKSSRPWSARTSSCCRIFPRRSTSSNRRSPRWTA